MHLSISDGRLTRLVKTLGLLAAVVDFRANPINVQQNRGKLLVKITATDAVLGPGAGL